MSALSACCSGFKLENVTIHSKEYWDRGVTEGMSATFVGFNTPHPNNADIVDSQIICDMMSAVLEACFHVPYGLQASGSCNGGALLISSLYQSLLSG